MKILPLSQSLTPEFQILLEAKDFYLFSDKEPLLRLLKFLNKDKEIFLSWEFERLLEKINLSLSRGTCFGQVNFLVSHTNQVQSAEDTQLLLEANYKLIQLHHVLGDMRCYKFFKIFYQASSSYGERFFQWQSVSPTMRSYKELLKIKLPFYKCFNDDSIFINLVEDNLEAKIKELRESTLAIQISACYEDEEEFAFSHLMFFKIWNNTVLAYNSNLALCYTGEFKEVLVRLLSDELKEQQSSREVQILIRFKAPIPGISADENYIIVPSISTYNP